MRQVVIAFATTGNDPKAGARISELAAIEQEDRKPTGRTLHLTFATAEASDGGTFAQQFDLLDNLIGDATIVVFNAASWRKFLRPELRQIKGRGARRLLTETADVSLWVRKRFPRQRKDLRAIARRLGLETRSDSAGVLGDATILAALFKQMKARDDETIDRQPAFLATPRSRANHEDVPSLPRSIGERLTLCWRILVGQD